MSRWYPAGAMNSGDENEFGPFRVALANLNLLADGQSQWRTLWDLMLLFRHNAVHDVIFAHKLPRRNTHFDGVQPDLGPPRRA